MYESSDYKKEVTDYINTTIDEINGQFPLLIDMFSRENFISTYLRSNKPLDEVKREIDEIKINTIKNALENEKLSENNKSIYKQVLKRQYQDLKYEIKDETIDGKNASVVVKITVYDLYKSNVNSEYYLNEHQDEFYTIDNTFDSDLYDKYKNYKPQDINPTSEKEALLNQWQQYNFALIDLGMYLDVYPNDKNALNLYKKY